MPFQVKNKVSPEPIPRDTRIGVFASFGFVLLALMFTMPSSEPLIFASGTNIPNSPLPSNLTSDEINRYRRDGFLIKRGLIVGSQLEQLKNITQEVYNERQNRIGFATHHVYDMAAKQVWTRRAVHAQVAFESQLPSMAAQLLGENESVRLLKDAAIAYTKSQESSCGYHVDDQEFWPTDVESTGVTFWIALTPTTIAEGGGVGMATSSHQAPWAKSCRKVIAHSTYDTCRMEEISPSCNTQLQSVSQSYDLQPGDVIMWDRWTFHRTEPFAKPSEVHEAKLRYTIRYIPSNAKTVSGTSECLSDGLPFRGKYFPQVWPQALKDEMKQW
mmetsp:Transcript_5441/g.8278  ORF Transcript_5441/g.8278 Transcript_5441/m.8278 type:complete len:329 (-) Transcript_5441:143-1129(-)|eukprot:CAMPEP_0195299380 /NCGR_PEP_ID=MMETSP0707-20130614/25442_1 /TAXON_ID=33640 /ORGANISM="Asterionellopsis glacialis, Strain CCMP134" /LENGTH=328 /DNA_ID=CAMNT_0040361775 /DNA_START=127 /DNA_END=1110 /DNA_ORIENTATION=+